MAQGIRGIAFRAEFYKLVKVYQTGIFEFCTERLKVVEVRRFGDFNQSILQLR